MAKYRPLYTKIWKDPDFQELSPEHKLVFIYLCTNEVTSESGIYPITPKTIADETAISRDQVAKLLENGNIRNVQYDPANRLVFIKNFHKYNRGGKPALIRQSILNDCETCPTTPLWQSFIETYPDFKADITTVCQRFANGLPTVVDKSALILISTKSQSQSQSQSQHTRATTTTTTKKTENNIFALYESNIGQLTPMITEELKAAERDYPAEWIEDAIKEAVDHNKRNWKYVEAILKRWQTDGRDSGGVHQQKTRGDDPDKFIKGKYGHMVKR